MTPCFVVERPEGGEFVEVPPLVVVERPLRVLDDGGYLCRVLDMPWAPCPWGEAVVRLGGVDLPEGACLRARIQAQAVKSYLAWRFGKAEDLVLRNFRRDGGGRLLADLWIDRCDVSAFLVETLRGG